MKYLLAVFCPPLALYLSGKTYQAIPSAILFALALATASIGVGPLIDFFLVLWAFRIVGESGAERQARAFVRTIRPIPVVRERHD